MPRTKLRKAIPSQSTLWRRHKKVWTKGYVNPRYMHQGKSPTSRGYVRPEPAAKERHYKDYVKRPYKPVWLVRTPGRPKGKGRVSMGELGPKIVFSVDIDRVGRYALETQRRGAVVVGKIIKSVRQIIISVLRYMQQDLVGDPRPHGGGMKGLVPRGGTGYMRSMTRSYLERQKLQKDFPFTVRLAVPVRYANILNSTKKRLSHNYESGWRIVDYLPDRNKLRPTYKKVPLNDPNAQVGFFDKIIELARLKGSTKTKVLFDRVGRTYALLFNKISEESGFNVDAYNLLVFSTE